MLAYTAKRLVLAVPVLLGLTVIVFLIMAMIPGDPATAILGSYATPENVARTTAMLARKDKVIADPRPVDVRAGELVADLELLQVRVDNAEENLDQHIPRWVELSNDFIDGFLLVLENEVPDFAERVGDSGLRDRLLAANDDGIAALT